jgi:hypothetical protein
MPFNPFRACVFIQQVGHAHHGWQHMVAAPCRLRRSLARRGFVRASPRSHWTWPCIWRKCRLRPKYTRVYSEANDLKPFSAVRDGRRLLCILPAKVPFHSGGAQASSQRPRLPRYARGRTVVQAKPLSYCRAVIMSSFILSFLYCSNVRVGKSSASSLFLAAPGICFFTAVTSLLHLPMFWLRFKRARSNVDNSAVFGRDG